ncbi:putative AGP3-protein of the amino-acid permease family [Tilletiaria anomala UBC 951]|uniref:Putative AGP3-protein of the amino-acid permease family n=1 Tax=Tilletiaria anomala (strain ATCC 24038 / CBS 436.72 / UBC 951) TaxID=1037660 RepID=A0A066VZ10_TILAU|nr:putative AGP3-protein of the amino-acid permease family [Tilletiaria anomala UBC 951]KDN43765.1 putative AGP3-protein of the amino-acid permease family [Tilletiaria anomala UBC 951]
MQSDGEAIKGSVYSAAAVSRAEPVKAHMDSFGDVESQIQISGTIHQAQTSRMNGEEAGGSGKSGNDDEGQLSRSLQTRHVVFMAIAGIIGPGLLVGSGNALATAGPAGALIAFAITGLIVYFIMQSLGEMSTMLPVPGSFITYSTRFIDPAFGFAVGWAYFCLWLCVLANEYVSVSIVLRYWPAAEKVPAGAWITIFWFVFMGLSLLGVLAFGEVEFWLATLKVLFILVFFILSIVITAGGTGAGVIGFKYYHDPGPFNGIGIDALNGIAKIFIVAGTLYAGVEMTSVVAAESRSPEKAVPRAIRSVFFRIVFLYLGTLFFISLTVPSNDDRLVSAGSKAGSSPLTIALERGGISAAASVINAIIVISVISAANSSLYIASRTLQSLAVKGQAPRFLSWTSKRDKVPIPALVTTNVLALFSLLSLGAGTSKAFTIIINLSGVCTFIVWAAIAWCHIRFRGAMRVQNNDVHQLVFTARWYPYGAWFALGANIFLCFFQGYTTILSPFDAGNFVVAYIILLVFVIFGVTWKLIFKTKFIPLHEIDIDTGRRWATRASLKAEKAQTLHDHGLGRRILRYLNRIVA